MRGELVSITYTGCKILSLSREPFDFVAIFETGDSVIEVNVTDYEAQIFLETEGTNAEFSISVTNGAVLIRAE